MATETNAVDGDLVLKYFRTKKPKLADVPDDILVRYIGETQPKFRQYPSFDAMYRASKKRDLQAQMADLLQSTMTTEEGISQAGYEQGKEVAERGNMLTRKPTALALAGVAGAGSLLSQWAGVMRSPIGQALSMLPGGEILRMPGPREQVTKAAGETGRGIAALTGGVAAGIEPGKAMKFAETLTSTAVGSSPSIVTSIFGGIDAASAAAGLQTFGQMYDEGIAALEEKGVPTDEAKRRMFWPAVRAGVFTAATTRVMPGVERMTANAAKGVLSAPGFRAKLLAGAKGTAFEALQEGTDQTHQEFIKGATYDPDMTFMDVVKNSALAAAMGGVLGGVAGTVKAVYETKIEKRRQEQGQQIVQVIEAALDKERAKASEALQEVQPKAEAEAQAPTVPQPPRLPVAPPPQGSFISEERLARQAEREVAKIRSDLGIETPKPAQGFSQPFTVDRMAAAGLPVSAEALKQQDAILQSTFAAKVASGEAKPLPVPLETMPPAGETVGPATTAQILGVIPPQPKPLPSSIINEGVTTITPEMFRKKLADLGDDLTKASRALSDTIQSHLANGGLVTLFVDGKKIPIVSSDNGMMKDAKGQNWGTMSLATGINLNNRVEFSKPVQNISEPAAEPAPSAPLPAPQPEVPAVEAPPSTEPAPKPLEEQSDIWKEVQQDMEAAGYGFTVTPAPQPAAEQPGEASKAKPSETAQTAIQSTELVESSDTGLQRVRGPVDTAGRGLSSEQIGSEITAPRDTYTKRRKSLEAFRDLLLDEAGYVDDFNAAQTSFEKNAIIQKALSGRKAKRETKAAYKKAFERFKQIETESETPQTEPTAQAPAAAPERPVQPTPAPPPVPTPGTTARTAPTTPVTTPQPTAQKQKLRKTGRPKKAEKPPPLPAVPGELESLQKNMADVRDKIAALIAARKEDTPEFTELSMAGQRIGRRMIELETGVAPLPTKVQRALDAKATAKADDILRQLVELREQQRKLIDEVNRLPPEQTEKTHPQKIADIENQITALEDQLRAEVGPEPMLPDEPILGITSQDVIRAANMVKKLWRWMRPEYNSDPPQPIDLSTSSLPALAPQDQYKQAMTRPSGAGKIPVFGRFYDARHRGAEPVKAAFIVKAIQDQIGRNVGVVNGAKFAYADKLFAIDRKTGKVTTVPGEWFLQDLATAYYNNKGGDFGLTPGQKTALDDAQDFLKSLIKLMADEGVPRAVALEIMLETADVLYERTYFPRSWVGKVSISPEGEPELQRGARGGARLSTVPPALRSRKFKSEREGFQAGHRYIDSFSGRLAQATSNAYSAIASWRLVNDPNLGGQTKQQRMEQWADGIFPELGALKVLMERAQTKEQKQALYSKYIETYDEIKEDYPEEFSRVAEDIGSPKAGEGMVSHPLFSNYIFDADTAKAINERIRAQPHKIVQLASFGTKVSNAFVLALDHSAPLVQGLNVLFYSLATRNNIWGKAYAASWAAMFKDPEYLPKLVAKLEPIINEYIQMGGSIGRLQDYAAGLERGEFVTQLKYIGPAFRRAGAAFGAMLDYSKILWWQAVRDQVPRAEWPQAIERIEDLVGSGRMEAAGLHPSIAEAERIVWRAASYYRSGLNVLAGMFDKGYTGKMTRQALGSMFAGTTAMAIAGMIAAGLSPDEIWRKLARLDLTIPIKLPNGKSVNLGFSNIALALIKAAVRTGLYIADGKAINSGGMRQNPILRFLWGHAGPIPGAMIEIGMAEDFLGNPMTIEKTLAKQIAPLTMQQVGQSFMREGVTSAVGDAIGTSMGLAVYPETYAQAKMRESNIEARKRFGVDYDQLGVFDQRPISKTVGEKLGKKPEATRRQIEVATEEDHKRTQKIADALPKDVRQYLNNYQIRVRGIDRSISVLGEDVVLSNNQIERLQELVTEEYQRSFENLMRYKAFEKMTPKQREKVADDTMRRAKDRAKTRFLFEERKKSAAKKSVQANGQK